MADSLALADMRVAWFPERRLFTVQQGILAEQRHHEPRLAEWIRDRAGGRPYGVLVSRGTGASVRATGYALAEMWRERALIRIACLGYTQSERFTIPLMSAITGVKMRAFDSRDAAEAWLAGEVVPVNPSTSATATP